MLDKSLLHDFDHIVATTANSAQMDQDLGQLLQAKVPMQALIHHFLLDKLPKLIVLNVPSGSALNTAHERCDGLAVECGELLFDHGDDHAPKLGRFLKLVIANELETIHDLLWSHDPIAELLVDVDNIRCVLAMHQHCVDFVEDHAVMVIKVVIAASMDRAQANRGDQACLAQESGLMHSWAEHLK